MRLRALALIACSVALTVPRPVIAAKSAAPPPAPAPENMAAPMRVVLMVDTSDGIGPAITQIREAVLAFADALPPEDELALVTTGRRVQVRVPPTADREKVKSSARGLTNDHGATPLMDALIEVDERFLRKAEDRTPALVVITGDGSESSTATDDKGFNKWLATLAARQVAVEAIVLKFKGSGLPEAIVDAAARAGGGHVEKTTAVNELPAKLKAVAARLEAGHAR